MWLDQRRSETDLDVSAISLNECQEWKKENGSIRHHTRGFFEIAGLRTNSIFSYLDNIHQPIIHQPELGILGFVVASCGLDKYWLLQAKPEPGNVHGVQLAPTVQATYSNYSRLHGGDQTYYLQFFTSGAIVLESDCLHSEQGTRFYQKFNRNAICVVPFPFTCVTDAFCWHNARMVQQLLLEDYTVNTDARSVMVTGPWRLISSDPTPFMDSASKGWGGLQSSYTAPVPKGLRRDMARRISKMRRAVRLTSQYVDIDELKHWHFTDDALSHSVNGAFKIGFYNVNAPTREIPVWDQPLLKSSRKDDIILFAQRQRGLLRFMLRFSFEVGLKGGVELGASYKKESRVPLPDWLQEAVDGQVGTVRASIEQSDEGGRFMRSKSRYSVIELPEDFSVEHDAFGFWFTLAELEALCGASKLLTNEARSAISLLLAFA